MTTTDKQVYELTPADLRAHTVWYFPMDDTVANEATVRPVTMEVDPLDDFQVIVRSAFEDARGRRYVGYLYPGCDGVEYTQPMLFIDENGYRISFWYGDLKPSREQIVEVAHHFPRPRWPVRYESEPTFGIERTSGQLDGLYYLDGPFVRCCRL